MENGMFRLDCTSLFSLMHRRLRDILFNVIHARWKTLKCCQASAAVAWTEKLSAWCHPWHHSCHSVAHSDDDDDDDVMNDIIVSCHSWHNPCQSVAHLADVIASLLSHFVYFCCQKRFTSYWCILILITVLLVFWQKLVAICACVFVCFSKSVCSQLCVQFSSTAISHCWLITTKGSSTLVSFCVVDGMILYHWTFLQVNGGLSSFTII